MIQPDDFGELFIRVLEKKTKTKGRWMGMGRRGRMIKCIQKSIIRGQKIRSNGKKGPKFSFKYGLK